MDTVTIAMPREFAGRLAEIVEDWLASHDSDLTDEDYGTWLTIADDLAAASPPEGGSHG